VGPLTNLDLGPVYDLAGNRPNWLCGLRPRKGSRVCEGSCGSITIRDADFSEESVLVHKTVESAPHRRSDTLAVAKCFPAAILSRVA